MLTFEGSQFLGVENIMEKLQVRPSSICTLIKHPNYATEPQLREGRAPRSYPRRPAIVYHFREPHCQRYRSIDRAPLHYEH